MSAAPDLGPESGLLARLAASRMGRAATLLLRWGIPLALLVIIGRRLTEIGWGELWRARPINAGFYLLLVAQFFLQPLGDLLVYRMMWGANHAPPAAVILRKRLMNTFMLDYSGEAYFFFWALHNSGLPTARVAHGIKDSNLLSGGAGIAMVFILGAILLAFGGLHVPALPGSKYLYALMGIAPLVGCAVLIIAHRKVTILSRAQLAGVFGIHFARACTVLAIEFGLWQLSGAMAGWIMSLQFVALRLVITRLPVVPNKDLIFVGAGLAAAGAAHAAVTPVATVLVILAAADLILAATVAGLTAMVKR
jgi:hypothetical protein